MEKEKRKEKEKKEKRKKGEKKRRKKKKKEGKDCLKRFPSAIYRNFQKLQFTTRMLLTKADMFVRRRERSWWFPMIGIVLAAILPPKS